MINIELGRKGFATKGKAEKGRISYEEGIALALSTFRDAQSTADPQIIIFAEYTFLNQELQFCEEADTDSLSSLTQAIQSFDDAFLALKDVEDSSCQVALRITFQESESPCHRRHGGLIFE